MSFRVHGISGESRGMSENDERIRFESTDPIFSSTELYCVCVRDVSIFMNSVIGTGAILIDTFELVRSIPLPIRGRL